MSPDDPRWTATLAWDELLCEIGAMCEMDHNWCTIHGTAGTADRCATGRAIDDMAVALSGLHEALQAAERLPGTPSAEGTPTA